MRLLRRRSARSGRFTTPADAAANPDTTVAETVSDLPELVGRLRWRISDLKPALAGAAEIMQIEARRLRQIDPNLEAIAARLDQAAAEAMAAAASEPIDTA